MKPIATILFLVVLASCELVTQIDIPESPPMAVVNSVFTPDSTWLINVSTSSHILSNVMVQVADAQVILTDEAGLQIPLTEDPFNPSGPGHEFDGYFRGKIFRGTTRPLPGMTYRIEVSGSNVSTTSATSRTPVAVELHDAMIDSANAIQLTGDYSGFAIPVEFTIDDPVGEPDYYYPRMFQVMEFRYFDYSTGDSATQRFTSYVQLVKEIPSSDFFDSNNEVDGITDIPFDGKHHTFKLYIVNYGFGPPQGKVVSLTLYLNHANEEYFRYFRSLQLHENSRDNPFAEPVQVFTNVVGGVGIFVGSTSSSWEFK